MTVIEVKIKERNIVDEMFIKEEINKVINKIGWISKRFDDMTYEEVLIRIKVMSEEKGLANSDKFDAIDPTVKYVIEHNKTVMPYH